MPLTHRIRAEKIGDLRGLATKALAETYQAAYPWDACGPGGWGYNVAAMLGGPTGEYCAAVHPGLLVALLDELERLRAGVGACP